MSATEYTYDDVKTHDSKKDLWVVINGRVYDITAFVDEHPGGEEVLLDVAGHDATEAFDDVGHSDDARGILQTLLKGNLQGGLTKPPPKSGSQISNQTTSSESGITLYAIVLAGVALAYAAYMYLQ